MRICFVYSFLLIILSATSSLACDPCAIYTASKTQGARQGSFSLSLAEQFTHFKRPSDENRENVAEQDNVREFSITQIGLSYDLSDVVSFQLMLPVVYRRSERVVRFREEEDSQTGFGDLVLLANYFLISEIDVDSATLLGISAGVKLPSGSTRALREFSDNSQSSNGAKADAIVARHHTIIASGGGRALPLGSGSVDYIVAANLYVRNHRYYALSYLQYSLRTEGDYSYKFADDFLWSLGPGMYLAMNDTFSLASRLAVSGEYKGKDRFRGEVLAGSNLSNLYVGPEFILTLGDSVAIELAIDKRVSSSDSSLIIPQYRVRAGVSYRF